MCRSPRLVRSQLATREVIDRLGNCGVLGVGQVQLPLARVGVKCYSLTCKVGNTKTLCAL